MKRKTIEKVLTAIHNKWLETIDDKKLREVLRKNTIITGGCIASMLLKEKVNDYDFYFRNSTTALIVAEYYVKKFKELNPGATVGHRENLKNFEFYAKMVDERVRIFIRSQGTLSEDTPNEDYRYFEAQEPGSPGAELFIEQVMSTIKRDRGVKEGDAENKDKTKYRPIFLTSNAISLSDKVQLIIRFYGEPDEIHDNYDFVHCMNYWDSATGKVTLRPEALEAMLTRQLIYKGSLYPVCSIIRLRKFIARNWKVSAGDILKMILQCGELDLTDPVVLEDQLIGVDIAYFMELITKIKDELKSGKVQHVDSTYVAKLIDEIF